MVLPVDLPPSGQAAPALAQDAPPPYVVYEVQSGDTLWDIAARHGTEVRYIVAANPELAPHPDLVRPGERYLVPLGPGLVHRLAEGETVEEVAALYQVDAEAIKEHPANASLGPAPLPGSLLFVPGAQAPSGFPRPYPWERAVVTGEAAPPSLEVPAGAPVWGLITSRFGEVSELRGGKPHSGIDIAAPLGSPVRATAGGRVAWVGYDPGGYGVYVVIEHRDGIATLYAHLERARVAAGQAVRRGDVVGAVGNSGLSTGPHLHYEIRVAGRPVDPQPYLEGRR